jgi:hypothetical protein
MIGFWAIDSRAIGGWAETDTLGADRNTGSMRFNDSSCSRTSHDEIVTGWTLCLSNLMNMNIVTFGWTATVGAPNLLNCAHGDNLDP